MAQGDGTATEGQRPRGRMNDFDLLRERLEMLSGSRTQFRDRAAVQIRDLNGIVTGTANMQAVAVAAAPTAAQYNLLLQDVARLNRQLQAVTQALTKRLHTP